MVFIIRCGSPTRRAAPRSPAPGRMDVFGAVLGGVTQILLHGAELSFLKFKLACLLISILFSHLFLNLETFFIATLLPFTLVILELPLDKY